MADHSRDRDDGLATALVIHLSFYCAAAACFGLVLYALMQPSRSDNPGLAAYRPPPGTALMHVPPTPNDGLAGAPALTLLPDTETTGRAMHDSAPQAAERSAADAQPQAASTPPRPPRTKSKPRREVSSAPAARASACIPGYDSAGAQTRPC